MKELTTQNINEMLGKGIEIELECINKLGYENDHYLNKSIFRNGETLTVETASECGDLTIKGLAQDGSGLYRIRQSEFKYFRIK